MTTHLTFGTMQWGGKADAAASRSLFEACLDAAITDFDTACGYTDGMAETLLGQFAKGHDTLNIATKVAYFGGAGRDNIIRQFDGSRKRLNRDQVDLLYIHRWDADTALEETIGTLAELQSKGQIRQIGLSNCAAWQVMKAQAVAATLGTRIDAMQPMYNLVKRQAEVELLPMAMDQGIKVIPYSPLGGGLLTGKYASGGTGRLTTDERYAARYGPPHMHRAAADLSALAATRGIHPATLAVAWVAAHPARPSPIISAHSVAQLAPSLAAVTFDMTAALYADLCALSPTPPPATDRLEEA